MQQGGAAVVEVEVEEVLLHAEADPITLTTSATSAASEVTTPATVRAMIAVAVPAGTLQFITTF